MTPGQARAARAFLDLDMKTVCEQAPVGKRTLTEFERGSRLINDTTLERLKSFYTTRGVEFLNSNNREEVILRYSFSDVDLVFGGSVREKIEYEDRLNLIHLQYEVEKLVSSIGQSNSMLDFSRLIIIASMKDSGLNQKQLALALNCSAAFISAILLNKKIVSVDLAQRIQALCGLRGLVEAAISEKRIKKYLLDMRRLANEITKELDHIKTVNAVA